MIVAKARLICAAQQHWCFASTKQLRVSARVVINQLRHGMATEASIHASKAEQYSGSVRQASTRASQQDGGTETSLPTFVTPAWLNSRLGSSDLKILDASWFLPTMNRNVVAEFKASRIPTSQLFDMDGVADVSRDLPHMLPSAHAFAAAMDALRIRNDDVVVLYDRIGVFSTPRVWWTFRVFGHRNVAILEGGFVAWEKEGYDIDRNDVSDDEALVATRAAQQPPAETQYRAAATPPPVKDMQEVARIAQQRSMQIVDCRPSGRYIGKDPEPRPGLLRGHIPGALSVPFLSLLDGDALGSPKLKPKEQLRQVIERAGVKIGDPIVASCGSGSTACFLVLALHELGVDKDVWLYDGSWSEWGHPSAGMPIENPSAGST